MRFIIGERVLANTKDHFNGLIGTIVKINDPDIYVKLDSYNGRSDVEVLFQEPELHPIVNYVTPTFSNGIGYFSSSMFGGGGSALEEFSKLNDIKPMHTCKFNKTYTGLLYKEDICECGKGTNRRGIYE